MTTKSKYAGLLILLLIIGVIANAQEYGIMAALPEVPASDFYKIPVTAELTGYANDDLSDIRISADSNVFAPYIHQRGLGKTNPGSFINCTILSKTTEGKYTTILLENPVPAGISNICLEIGNTEVHRYSALSGSDDEHHWFVINDSLPIPPHYSNNTGKYKAQITFPFSKYKYFQLKINNTNSDPLNILSASVYTSGKLVAPLFEYIIDPAPSVTQKDSNRISYIIIKNQAPYLADSVSIDVTGPRFYERNATAYIMSGNNDSGNLYNAVARFTLSSDQHIFFKIGSRKAATIILEIDNKDNPPLKVTNVTVAQEQQYLIAWLEKGKKYTLLAANPNAAPPQYDLSHFKENIPDNPQVLSYGPLTPVPKTKTATAKQTSNYWLWPTIIIAVIVLSFLTYKLMKDIKHNGD